MHIKELVHDVELAINEEDATAAYESYQWLAEAQSFLADHMDAAQIYCFLDLVIQGVENGLMLKLHERVYMVCWITWLIDHNPNMAVKMLKARYVEFYKWVRDGDWQVAT